MERWTSPGAGSQANRRAAAVVAPTAVPGAVASRRAPCRVEVLIAILLGVVVLLALPGTADAQNRSERIGDLRIAATLAPDGSLRVVEDRQFIYDGSFQGAFIEIPLRDGQRAALNSLTDERGTTYRAGACSRDGAKVPGEYEVVSNDEIFRVTWCWDPPPTDTSRTITLDYFVSNAGVRHEDSSELYWQFVGDGWDVPTESVVVDVALPTGDVQFWAHGPLTGTVERAGDRTVQLAVDDLPANTFVELRALMPAGALSQADSDGRDARQQILDEEQCLAVAADADRARARGQEPAQDCDPAAGRKRVLSGLLAVGLLGGGVGWWELFRRHGREYPLRADIAEREYEHDLPSEHPPAHVDYLLQWGSVSEKALTATVLDLARRGHIKVRREMVTRDRVLLPDREEPMTVFERHSEPERGWEQRVMELLFDDAGGGGKRVTDRGLKDWVASHRDDAYRWWQSWTSGVTRDTAGARWIESHVWVGASVAIGLALIGVAVGAAFLGANLLVVGLTIAAGVGAAAASPLMRRRTPEGRELEHRWRRFGAYLTDYSLIPERGPEYLALWGHWLVYAVPLGVAETVINNLETKLSEAELEQVGGGWYPMMYYHGHLYGGFGDGLRSVTAAIPTSQIASSPSSSTGGGGGGSF